MTISTSVAPAAAPAPALIYLQNQYFLRDRHYGQHGKRMLLSVVSIILLFLFLLVVVHCRKHIFKRRRGHHESRLQDVVPCPCHCLGSKVDSHWHINQYS
uniref:Uncharacterized protein n=1 Tax=Chenopodium quinoa TaxID=63459 RepID=A0A803MY97_CHEQI